MSDDQFTRLFKYMQEEFGKIRAELGETRQSLGRDIDRVYNLVDADLKMKETDEQERLASNRQLEQHDAWIKQLAKNTSTKLVSEQ